MYFKLGIRNLLDWGPLVLKWSGSYALVLCHGAIH